jgi:hypothetical protein
MNALRSCFVAATLIMLSCPAVRAGDGVCAHCGCSACVRKVCVPKRTEKEIVKVCWDYKCEDVCIPGRSKKCGVECREDARGEATRREDVRCRSRPVKRKCRPSSGLSSTAEAARDAECVDGKCRAKSRSGS